MLLGARPGGALVADWRKVRKTPYVIQSDTYEAYWKLTILAHSSLPYRRQYGQLRQAMAFELCRGARRLFRYLWPSRVG
jgi:hypothetical protein